MTKGSDAKTQRAPVTGARINRVATVIHAVDCDYERADTDPVRPQSENQAAICARSDFLLESFADRANFGCRQRALLDLQEVPLSFLAIVRRQLLDLVHHGVDASNHCLAPLGSLDQFGTERFDLFHRCIVFANHGFGGELADLIDAFLVLDVIGHRAFR